MIHGLRGGVTYAHTEPRPHAGGRLGGRGYEVTPDTGVLREHEPGGSALSFLPRLRHRRVPSPLIDLA